MKLHSLGLLFTKSFLITDLISILTMSAQIISYQLSLEDFMFLIIYAFLLVYSITWHINLPSNLLWLCNNMVIGLVSPLSFLILFDSSLSFINGPGKSWRYCLSLKNQFSFSWIFYVNFWLIFYIPIVREYFYLYYFYFLIYILYWNIVDCCSPLMDWDPVVRSQW